MLKARHLTECTNRKAQYVGKIKTKKKFSSAGNNKKTLLWQEFMKIWSYKVGLHTSLNSIDYKQRVLMETGITLHQGQNSERQRKLSSVLTRLILKAIPYYKPYKVATSKTKGNIKLQLRNVLFQSSYQIYSWQSVSLNRVHLFKS